VALLLLVADAMAACLSCSASRRDLSSVLNPRPRGDTILLVLAASRILSEEARLSSPKMSSL
jgi:hypothetical protein